MIVIRHDHDREQVLSARDRQPVNKKSHALYSFQISNVCFSRNPNSRTFPTLYISIFIILTHTHKPFSFSQAFKLSRIAQHFGISLKTNDSIPYSLFDEKFIKNSNQLKKVNNLFMWKNEEAVEEEHDQDMQYIDLVASMGLAMVPYEEPSDPPPPPSTSSSQRKRARASSSQSMEGEPEWVGGFFDRLSIMETNINNRFDQFDSRFDHFERRMDHVEYDVHQLQAYHNISCT